jgi:hypothetical protein
MVEIVSVTCQHLAVGSEHGEVAERALYVFEIPPLQSITRDLEHSAAGDLLKVLSRGCGLARRISADSTGKELVKVGDEDDVALEDYVCKDFAHILFSHIAFHAREALVPRRRLRRRPNRSTIASSRNEAFVDGSIVPLHALITSSRNGRPKYNPSAWNVS